MSTESNATQDNTTVGEALETVVDQEVETTEAESQEIAVTEDAPAAPDDEAETTDDDDESETDEVKVKKAKSNKNFNKRIQQVIEQREQADKRAAQLERELEEYRKGQTAKPETNFDAGFSLPKPEAYQYNTIAEFTEAYTDWKDEQREFVREQKAQRQRVEENVAKTTEVWNTREKTVKTEFEDYDAVVNVDMLNAINLTKDSHISARIFLTDSDIGPRVLYELGQDDELMSKFKTASPVQQIKILTKLESLHESITEAPATAKTTTKEAIKPLPKLKGGVISQPKTMDQVVATGDFAEYVKFRNSQKKKS